MDSGLAMELVFGSAEGRARWRRPGMTPKDMGNFTLFGASLHHSETSRNIKDMVQGLEIGYTTAPGSR